MTGVCVLCVSVFAVLYTLVQFIGKWMCTDKMLENFIYPLPQTWQSHFSLVLVLLLSFIFTLFCCCCSCYVCCVCAFHVKLHLQWGSWYVGPVHLRTRHPRSFTAPTAPSICTTAIAHFIFAWIFDCAKQRLLCTFYLCTGNAVATLLFGLCF